jgi:hypothetical protein
MLQHYPAVAGEGIELSALTELEEELSAIVGLADVDFQCVAAQWQKTVQPPSVAAFINDLRLQCAVRLKSRRH